MTISFDLLLPTYATTVDEHLTLALYDLMDCSLSGKCPEPAVIQRLILFLPLKHRIKLKEAVEIRNSKVVNFNPVLSALRGCNTAIYYISTGAAAKSAMFYLLKYLSKDPSSRASTLSVAKAALQDIAMYPSVAENTGTDTRTAQHWLNRIMNIFNGYGEFSAQLVASALLGVTAEPMSHRAQTFDFSRLLPLFVAQDEDVDDSDDEEDEIIDLLDRDQDITDERPDLCNCVESEDEDGEIKKAANPIQRRSSLNLAHRNRKSNARVDEPVAPGCKNPDIVGGDAVFVTHDEGYKYLPDELASFTLYEFFCTCSIVPKKISVIKSSDVINVAVAYDEEQREEDNDPMDDEDNSDRIRPGVKKTKTFEFNSDCPFHKTHEIRPRSKIIIPKLQPTPPR